MQIEALKEACWELKSRMAKRIYFRSDPRRTPHLHCVILCRWPSGESIGEKDVIGDKENAGTQEKFLEAMQERAPALNSARLEPEKTQFNGLDQVLRKMTASIKERGRRYVTVKTTSKTKKLSLKTKEINNWTSLRKLKRENENLEPSRKTG